MRQDVIIQESETNEVVARVAPFKFQDSILTLTPMVTMLQLKKYVQDRMKRSGVQLTVVSINFHLKLKTERIITFKDSAREAGCRSVVIEVKKGQLSRGVHLQLPEAGALRVPGHD